MPKKRLGAEQIVTELWQAEALWLNFRNTGPDWGLDFPVAVKVVAGKINAVTGEPPKRSRSI